MTIFVLFFYVTVKKLTILEIEHESQHYEHIYQYPYVISIFYNWEKIKNFEFLRKTVDELAEQDYLIGKNVGLEFIDLEKIDFFKRHYEMEEGAYLKLFIQKQIWGFKQFTHLVEGNSEKMVEKVLEFIKSIIEDIVVEINDV